MQPGRSDFTVQAVAPQPADEPVEPGAADQVVVAVAAPKVVGTDPAFDPVVPGVTGQLVIAGPAGERVVAIPTRDLVVAGAAVQRMSPASPTMKSAPSPPET